MKCKIYKKKKAVFQMALGNLIGIVIAVFLIIVSAYVFYKIATLFIPDPGQESKASLRRFGFEIGKMELGEHKSFTLFLDENYYLIGYVGENAEKPSKECTTNDCLCVCDSKTCDDDVSCINLQNVYLHSEKTPTGISVLIVGENVFGINKGLQKLYMCKQKNVDLVRIYLAEELDDVSDFDEFKKKEYCSGGPVYTADVRKAVPDDEGNIIIDIPDVPGFGTEE